MLTGREELRENLGWGNRAKQFVTKGKGGAWNRLNLLFLIDDLDRCLPEKAVEMLEAIKLFLEVEGCAFVLGIDDEVVDRGILHRYRDYNLAKSGVSEDGANGQGARTTAPVTGAEYLEKIIHLPVRVPLPPPAKVQEFLAEKGAEFFRQEQDRMVETSGGESRPDRLWEGEDPVLVKLAGLIPPVPRKIVRAGELLELLKGVNQSDDGAQIDRETLALLGLIQLFAPALFRRLRRHPGDMITICRTWREQAKEGWQSPKALDGWLKTKTKEYSEPGKEADLNNLHRRWEPLAAVIAEVAAPRSGFDVYRVLNEITIPEGASVASLRPWFALVALETKPAAEAAVEGKPPAVDERAIASLRRPEAFVEEFGVSDSGAWAAAVEAESEALVGRRLGEDALSKLREVAQRFVAVWDAETRVRWLGALKPYLAAADFSGLKEAVQWEQAHGELDRQDAEPKQRNASLALLDAVEPRLGVGLNDQGLPDIEWVRLDAGWFPNGSLESDELGYDHERPAHWVRVGPLEVSRWPMTVAQFGAFIAAGAYQEGSGCWVEDDGSLEWLRENKQPESLSGDLAIETLPRTQVS